jgi:hypothetical protein
MPMTNPLRSLFLQDTVALSQFRYKRSFVSWQSFRSTHKPKHMRKTTVIWYVGAMPSTMENILERVMDDSNALRRPYVSATSPHARAESVRSVLP